MIFEFMMRTTVNVVIDPESEYTEFTRNLGGDVINAEGGGFIINPLQFKSISLDKEKEEEGMSKLAHFKSLEVFFKLYAPDITGKQMSLLKQLLE